MEKIQYKKLRARAEAHATAKGFPEHAQDFAQEAAFKVSRGRKAKIKDLFTDFLRQTFGDTRTGDKKGYAALRYAETRAWVDASAMEEQLTDSTAVVSKHDFFRFIKRLKPNEKAMLILRFKWELDGKEIGECFGITEGRVSQIFKEIYAKLRKNGQC